MRSIFKKIAFVLALVMIVTTMPAREAAAATTPSVKKTKRVLYIGGDEKEQYLEKVWVGVKNKGDYTVQFESDNEDVVTVTKKSGWMIARGIGETTVRATFSKKGAKDVVSECKVIVRQNASTAGIDETSEKALAELVVGEKVTMVSTKTGIVNGESKTVAGSSKDFTSLVRFESSNEEIFTVDRKTGEITPVAPGEAELKVFGVQWEYDKTAKKKMSARIDGSETTYKVVVKAKDLEAIQSAWNKIDLTFGTEADAKVAVDKTNPSLNNASAAVSENKEIIKVYKVLKNSNNSEQAVFISGLGQNGNKVTVSLFDEMDEETEYIVRYLDQEKRLTTGKYVANDMDIYPEKVEKLGTDSSKTIVGFHLYTTGVAGQKVDITGARKYIGWDKSVDLIDLNKETYHSEYVFDATERTIWFYTANPNYAVNLKATFEDWYNNVVDNKANVLTATKPIHPGDLSTKVDRIVDWGIVKISNGTHWHDYNDLYKQKKFAAEDIDRMLAVEIELQNAGVPTKIKSCDSDLFKFVSSNDDKLAINEKTGALYPPKTATDGIVRVHIYYDNVYAGSVDITVYAKRVLTNFTAEINNSKLSYNENDKDVQDVLTITMKPVDQLGDDFNVPEMTYDVQWGGNNAANYLNLEGGTSPVRKISVLSGANLPERVTNFRVICTGTYDDGKTKITKKYSVSFSAKNTTKETTARSYNLVASYPEGWNWGKVDMNMIGKNVTDKEVTISGYSYDRDGFKINKLALVPEYSAENLTPDKYGNIPPAAAKGRATVVIQFGNEYVNANNLVQAENGKDLVFKTVRNGLQKSIAKVVPATGSAVSASAIVVDTVSNAIEKIKESTYSVNLFIGDETRAVFKNSFALPVSDSEAKVQWNWIKYSTSKSANTPEEALEAIKDCFKFWYQNTWNEVTGIYIGEVKDGKLDFNVDYTLKGDSLYIDHVRYLVTEGDGSVYEQVIDIKRTIRVNVPD